MPHLRPLESGDAPLARRFLARLSDDTLSRRFNGCVKRDAVSLAWLDELDGRDRVALGACEPATGELAGVARYVRDDGEPAVAELAITVLDGWQRRGLGTRLALALAAHAHACGIARLRASFAADQRACATIMRRLGPAVASARCDGVHDMTVALGPAQPSMTRSS